MEKEYNVVSQLAIVSAGQTGRVLIPINKYHCKTHEEMDALEKKLIKEVKDIFKMYRKIYCLKS